MATLIPSITSCISSMSPAEKRFAARLRDKLQNDYLCWYKIAIDASLPPPDFTILHPKRGLLFIQVADWRADKIMSVDEHSIQLRTSHSSERFPNTLQQASRYLFTAAARFESDAQLVWPAGSLKGKSFVPGGYGLALPHISRNQFDAAGLGRLLPSHLVICKDEMGDGIDEQAFQDRLWNMLLLKFNISLSLPQIDRIRWHLFPDMRICNQWQVNPDASMNAQAQHAVMDLKQERLARSTADGHCVLHGVAGSGKTMLLGYRARRLAAICRRPILIMCYSRMLAGRLAELVAADGIQDKVQVADFQSWCVQQLDAHDIVKPPRDSGQTTFRDACAERVMNVVAQDLIPTGQYDAILVDEGQDFHQDWLKLLSGMVHPSSNRFLLLRDDAQAIRKGKAKQFSYAEVGIQAVGRTHALKRNYRNTKEVLSVACAFAGALCAEGDHEHAVPLPAEPVSAGRHGPKPLLMELSSLKEEIQFLAGKLNEARHSGLRWKDMAIVYRRTGVAEQLAEILPRKGIPVQWQQIQKTALPTEDGVTLIAIENSKGLEFPLVCIPAIGRAMKNQDKLEEEAKLLYIAMTRATDQLVMTHAQHNALAEKVKRAVEIAPAA